MAAMSVRLCELSNCNWLPINQRIDFEIVNIVYKVLHSNQPSYLHLRSSVLDQILCRTLSQNSLHKNKLWQGCLLSSWAQTLELPPCFCVLCRLTHDIQVQTKNVSPLKCLTDWNHPRTDSLDLTQPEETWRYIRSLISLKLPSTDAQCINQNGAIEVFRLDVIFTITSTENSLVINNAKNFTE